MTKHSKTLESIANEMLSFAVEKPGIKLDYSNRDFENAILIFQSILICKLADLQINEKMDMVDRLFMVKKCGEDLNKLIHTFTGLDTFKYIKPKK